MQEQQQRPRLMDPIAGPAVIISIIPPNISQTIMGLMALDELRQIFQRALNTWVGAPLHLLQLSDQLDLIAQQYSPNTPPAH